MTISRKLYAVQCTTCSVRFTLYDVRLYCVQDVALCSVQCTEYYVHYTCTVHGGITHIENYNISDLDLKVCKYIVKYTVYNVHCTLYYVHAYCTLTRDIILVSI